jgi:hypothetical protein
LQFLTPKTPATFHSNTSNQRLHLEHPQLQQTPQNSEAAALELGEQCDSGRCEARRGDGDGDVGDGVAVVQRRERKGVF